MNIGLLEYVGASFTYLIIISPFFSDIYVLCLLDNNLFIHLQYVRIPKSVYDRVSTQILQNKPSNSNFEITISYHDYFYQNYSCQAATLQTAPGPILNVQLRLF